MLTNQKQKIKLETNNSDIIEMIELGRGYVRESKYDDAVELYSLDIGIEPYYEFYERRAFAYYKLNKFYYAIEDYSILISSDIIKPKYLINRGALYKKTHQYKECKDDLTYLMEKYKGQNNYEFMNYIEEELVIINNIIKENKAIAHSKDKIKDSSNINTEQAKYNSIKEDSKKINPTFEEALDILRDDYRMIRSIECPSKELQKFAVNICNTAIDYIENPCQEVLNNPNVIKYLKNKRKKPSRLNIPEYEDDEIRMYRLFMGVNYCGRYIHNINSIYNCYFSI